MPCGDVHSMRRAWCAGITCTVCVHQLVCRPRSAGDEQQGQNVGVVFSDGTFDGEGVRSDGMGDEVMDDLVSADERGELQRCVTVWKGRLSECGMCVEI